jgi:flagellar basal-body rod protein FlgF
MDHLLYVAMSGARHVMLQQDAVAHNLANASTVGYRAESNTFRALLDQGGVSSTRAYVVDQATVSDFTPGPISRTGNPLDVAIDGPGFIAIQGKDGKEAYTRAGNLTVSSQGMLQTQTGDNVLGDDGPIALPPDAAVAIAPDGTVSAVSATSRSATTVVGRIKLVNPAAVQAQMGDDGLFRLRSGLPAQADASVKLVPGALEGSNVNVVDAMTNMINLARQFDLHMKMIETVNTNDQKASNVLSLTA